MFVGPWRKYFVILLLSMGACFLLYEGCVRRFAVLRLVFGMREKPARSGSAGVPENG